MASPDIGSRNQRFERGRQFEGQRRPERGYGEVQYSALENEDDQRGSWREGTGHYGADPQMPRQQIGQVGGTHDWNQDSERNSPHGRSYNDMWQGSGIKDVQNQLRVVNERAEIESDTSGKQSASAQSEISKRSLQSQEGKESGTSR